MHSCFAVVSLGLPRQSKIKSADGYDMATRILNPTSKHTFTADPKTISTQPSSSCSYQKSTLSCTYLPPFHHRSIYRIHQTHCHLTMSASKDAKTIITARQHSKWLQQHQYYNRSDPYRVLSTSEQVTLPLSDRHNCLNHHVFTKFRRDLSELCPCKTVTTV